ncbi:MAG: anthranilate phosphoribosyltransferase, partial [Acidobacteria bacterium]|nr:anthranilate phosphoribosyltransferase [Acidobacteriota bacterium]
QVLGVFAADRVEPMARVLLELGTEHALVVHGDDGLDELTTTDSTLVCEVRNGDIEVHSIRPEDCGFERAAPEDLRGGDPAENAAAMRAVLSGQPGPLADVTALNAGAAIYVGGVRETLPQGAAAAREVLASGAAWAKLEELRSFA